MNLPKSKTSAARARVLRRRATPAESRPWLLLRGRRLSQLKFRRQVPCGPYILDFYCAEPKLAIEVDGSQHNTSAAKEYDEERSRFIASLEIQVLRFSNSDVRLRPDKIVESIRRSTVVNPHPDPLQQGEGEKKRR